MRVSPRGVALGLTLAALPLTDLAFLLIALPAVGLALDGLLAIRLRVPAHMGRT